ncbi:MAG: aminoacyl-tRNA hydrolase [Actinomycetales bacterium]
MTWLLAGLGNPGAEYAKTRHNVGFWLAEAVVRDCGGSLGRHKRAQAMVCETRVGGQPGERIVVVEPLSFMNASGGPVKALLDFYSIPVSNLIVAHDELDIPLASIRVKMGGGDNGHNGLRSIRSALGTGEFLRIRLGIGRPPGRQDPAEFVLKPFSADQRPEAETMVERAVGAVQMLILQGLPATQNTFNGDPP